MDNAVKQQATSTGKKFTTQLGTNNTQATTIIKTITKMAIKLAREQLWLPRCKTQIEWEKQYNITIKNKKSSSDAPKIATTKVNTQIKKPKQQNKQQFKELDGIFCYCGIAKQKHNNIS
ncbi:13603_t:CDS:2, partial [Ambispora gerdemannii]